MEGFFDMVPSIVLLRTSACACHTRYDVFDWEFKHGLPYIIIISCTIWIVLSSHRTGSSDWKVTRPAVQIERR